MSFSISTSGTAAEVRAAIKDWPAKIESNDRQGGQLLEVIEGHQRQVKAGVAQIEKFCDAAPTGYALNATCGGHADSMGGDSLWLSVGYSRPAAAATTSTSTAKGEASEPVAKAAKT